MCLSACVCVCVCVCVCMEGMGGGYLGEVLRSVFFFVNIFFCLFSFLKTGVFVELTNQIIQCWVDGHAQRTTGQCR